MASILSRPQCVNVHACKIILHDLGKIVNPVPVEYFMSVVVMIVMIIFKVTWHVERTAQSTYRHIFAAWNEGPSRCMDLLRDASEECMVVNLDTENRMVYECFLLSHQFLLQQLPSPLKVAVTQLGRYLPESVKPGGHGEICVWCHVSCEYIIGNVHENSNVNRKL